MRRFRTVVLTMLTLLAMTLLAALDAPRSFADASPALAQGDSNAKLTGAMQRMLAERAGPYRVWVFFADKGVRSQSEYDRAIAAVEAEYNGRAIERRRLRGANHLRGGALFDFCDLPLVEAYVDAVRDTGAELRISTTWLNAVSAEATEAQIEQIAALPFVAKVQPVAKSARVEPIDAGPQDPPAAPLGPLPGGRLDYGLSTQQLEQISLIGLHEQGYTGEGVIIGILDTGFVTTHNAFNQAGHELNVIAQYDFVDDDPIPEHDPSDGSRHGTLILGCIGPYMPGSLVGGAYDASFILCKTEDTSQEVPAEEDSYVAGLQFIEANGADMCTSSLGYIDWYTQADLDGETAVTTIAMNIANNNGLHACTAAGNEYHDSNPGTSSLIAPSDAFKVIACGAVDSGGTITSFSSDGPTADGRVKPEVLALGSGTDTVSPWDDVGYTTASGTSLSTPLVACAVACLIHAHPEWTVDELRDYLFQTAGYYVEHGTYDPLYVYGYGIVNALAANQGISFAFPNGLPTTVMAGVETIIDVKVQENYDGPIKSGSEKMFHRLGASGPFTETPMTHLGGADYQATLPALQAGAVVQFYFQVRTDGGTYYRSPDAAPDVLHEAGAVAVFHYFNLDADPGWSTEGEWQFGQPTGQGGTAHGNPDPTGGATGSNVFGINLNGDYSATVGGPYYLTTPALDCSELTDVELRFARWLNTDYPSYVYATVQVSTNGASWTTVWQNPEFESIEDNSWTEQTLDISSIADNQPTVYVRWGHEIGQSGAYAYSGWNIDDIQILASAPSPCPWDCQGAPDGSVGIDDLVAVINHWGPCP